MSWENFLHGNEWYWRLARTLVQAIVGILAASIDGIVAELEIDPAIKPIIVAAVMSLLSPLMAALGNNVYEKRVAAQMAADETIYG